MALVLSGSIDISGSMTATTILISSPGAAGMVSSSAQITELAPLMAYTASLKGAAIVSSSQQITNYYKFAETASANTFYGNQSISGSLNVGVGTSDNTVGDLFVDTANKTVYVGRQSSTSGDNTIFAVRNRLNTVNAFYVDPGGVGAVQMTGSLEVTRGVKLGTATGNVEVIGNLVMSTAGNGIDFSATANSAGTMTSELLNDYEEGTWTPVIGDLIPNDATMDGTYTRGSYIKIGKQVTVRGYILTTSLGSVTGNVKIKGLPFTNGSGFANLGGGSIGTASSLNITAGHSVHISTPIGANYLGLNVGDDAGGTTEMTAAEWSADGQIQMLATYFVD
jgi:hypothetical protein